MPSCMAKFGHWLCPPKLLANSQSINPRRELCTKKVSPIPVLRVWLTRPMRSENFGCPCLRSSWHSGTGPLVPMPNRLKVAVATFLPGRDIWKVEGGWVVAIGNWSDNWQVRWWATPRITSLWWWCAGASCNTKEAQQWFGWRDEASWVVLELEDFEHSATENPLLSWLVDYCRTRCLLQTSCQTAIDYQWSRCYSGSFNNVSTVLSSPATLHWADKVWDTCLLGFRFRGSNEAKTTSTKAEKKNRHFFKNVSQERVIIWSSNFSGIIVIA